MRISSAGNDGLLPHPLSPLSTPLAGWNALHMSPWSCVSSFLSLGHGLPAFLHLLSILQYIADASTEDKNEDINKIQSLAWKAINDSLRTDIPLLYPPYQIAIAALHLAVVFQGGSTHFVGWPSRFSAWPRLTLMLLTPHPLTHLPFLLTGKEAKWSQWFAELNVDFEKIIEITRQIMNFYEVLKTYDEKNEMPGILERVPKPKTAPSRPPSQGPEADRETKNAGH